MTALSDELLERDLQARCVTWWHQSGLPGLLFHVPNEGKRNRLEAASLAALGIVAGVADFVLLLPNGRVHLIEIKRPGCTQSTDQHRFEVAARELNHSYDVVHSLGEFSGSVLDAMAWWAEGIDEPYDDLSRSVLEIGAALPLP